MRRDAKIICPEFLDFVRSKSCTVGRDCLGPLDPHHVVAVGWRESKRNDFTALPLCRKHHGEIEQIGVEKFEAKYKVSVWAENAWLQIEFWLDEGRRAGATVTVSGRLGAGS